MFRKPACLAATMFAAAMLIPVATASADVVSSADIVFLVDESGSMGGEQAFLRDVINDLDSDLRAAGVSTINYGVVGFGGSSFFPGNLREVTNGNGSLVDLTPAETALGSLYTNGATEDGWAAINFALNTFNFTGSAINFILATDEDRDNTNGSLSKLGITSALQDRGVLLNVINNLRLRDGENEVALGVDNSGVAYIADGSGGYTTSTGGFALSGSGSTISDYFDIAMATGGAAWDLNQLRAGGLTATSFGAAFTAIKVAEITQVPEEVPEPATLGLFGSGLLGICFAVRRRQKA